MWVAKQTMIAATTMMWMAEALGYDTGPMEGFDEEQVRAVLDIPPHVRVMFLLAIGYLHGEDARRPGRMDVVPALAGEPPTGGPCSARKIEAWVGVVQQPEV